MNNQDTNIARPITDNPIPQLLETQLAKFTLESTHTYTVMPFEPVQALAALKADEGQRVIGADFGGDKGKTQLFVLENGQLKPDEAFADYVQGDSGDNYLASLEKTAAFAEQHNVPVGISWGAPLEGTKPLFHPKFKNFLSELHEKYDGDIAAISPMIKACLNDSPAGLDSGIIEANRSQPTNSVLFQINGGGLGMAVLKDGKIYSVEAGHVEAVPELNIYNQTTPCSVFGATHVCVERLGANKAGIEAQWEAARGGYMRARDIEDCYKAGDQFAGELYDNSAWVVAHMIEGTARVFDIDLTDGLTAVIGHGGAFKFPHYGERVLQILEQAHGAKPRLIMTKDFGNSDSNACLDGAAYAALIAE